MFSSSVLNMRSVLESVEENKKSHSSFQRNYRGNGEDDNDDDADDNDDHDDDNSDVEAKEKREDLKKWVAIKKAQIDRSNNHEGTYVEIHIYL